jgi:hypothetical protein
MTRFGVSVGGLVRKLRALRESTRLPTREEEKEKARIEDSVRALDSQDSVKRKMVRVSL